MTANRFAHLKPSAEDEVFSEEQKDLISERGSVLERELVPTDIVSLPDQGVELKELGQLVERRVGILGRIPSSLKDDYDEMLLRARKYIGRPNADLAVQAWVELTLQDESVQRRWLKRIQELRRL